MEIEQLQYPIGKYEKPPNITMETVSGWIDEIDALPHQLRITVENLTEEHLNTPYRPGGWTIRQVIHHLPDSHLNSYIRFRWALTENKPMIKAYREDLWAELQDAKKGDIKVSLLLLEALHMRWSLLLRSLNMKELQRSFVHPETKVVIGLDESIGAYAWHGKHHLAHIKNCIGLIEDSKK